MKKDPYIVQIFEADWKKNVYILNDSLNFEVLLEDFVQRVELQLL